MSIPDWQLPAGVNRGLWDYLHARDMIAHYDENIQTAPLARVDIAFCERVFPTPGRLLDLGCGTGRLCAHFTPKGFHCIGVDLSDEMLEIARHKVPAARFVKANIVEPLEFPDASLDYIACLFSTWGMICGAENRAQVLAHVFRLLKPGGRFVVHVHNRYFRGLGWKRVVQQWWKTLWGSPDAGDLTMPQAYGGAPLTLHHFTRREVRQLLERHGLMVTHELAVDAAGEPARGSRVYGWLFASQKSPEAS
ncbi:MAG: class I SAM-dependent methyltransferase [Gemmataceae bacterium]|nr:class I SAM-dependent methyltransferase [Gemmata sp.]MDW8198580.1 class I SAM-dependent methyltransferase [Gemmataceae bacterium]